MGDHHPPIPLLGSTAGPFAKLTDDEKRILQIQLDSPEVKASFLSLYRYADKCDYIITIVSIICAIGAGAALPLLTVLFGQLATTFQQVSQDTISYDEFESQLVRNVLYYVYIGIAEFGAIYISTVGFVYAGENITRKIREQYLKAILRQNMAYFDNLGAGEITTRITADTNLIQDGISQKVGLTLTAVATFVSAVIIAYTQYWKLALICTPTILCLVGAMAIGYRFIVKLSSKSLQCYALGGSVAGEVLSSIRTTTAFGTQERLALQYDVHLMQAAKYGVQMQIIQAVMVGSLGAIMFMTHGLGFWQGSRFLVDGKVDVGQVLTILMAIINGSYALGNVVPHGQAFTSAVAAASKIYSTIDRVSPLDPTSTFGKTLETVEGALELRNLKHIYPSRPEVVVLEDVTIRIPPGRTTALVGPSGSGKSTIIGLVERFYNPVGGNILLDGHNIQSLNLHWLRQQISLVSQEPVLFSTTVFENIRFGLFGTPFENEPKEKLRERVEEAAKTANAHDFITALPEGYQTQVGEQGFLLSGGQKQRIAIARAIVSDPRILLLDEATSALDTRSEGVVQAALDKAAEGRTTIVIAHRLSTVKLAYNIVVLVDGKMAEQGTHDELLNAQGEYFKLIELQSLHNENDTGMREKNAQELQLDPAEDTSTPTNLRYSLVDEVKQDESLNKEKATISLEPHMTAKAKPPPLIAVVKFIASFNRPELKLMLIGVVFVVLSGGGQPAQAVIYAKAITTLSLPPSQYGQVQKNADFWALMLLVLGIAFWITSSVHGTCLGIGAEKLICRARSRAFRVIMRQDIAFFDQEENSTGALISFLSTETKHLSGISGVTLGTILMVLTSLTAALIIALAIGWKMALVCMSIVPVVLVCGFYRVSMLTKFQAHSKQAYVASAGYACEATSAMRTVASLCREQDVLDNYHEQLMKQAQASLVPCLKSSMFYALSQGIYCFCTALGFWYGGTLLGKHEYTVFQLFVCFTEVIFGANAAGSIFSNAPDMAKAKSAAAEFMKLFNRVPSIDVWSDKGELVEKVEGKIEFRDVSFRYPTRPGHPVLSGLNLTVEPGQYVALVGSSGCGKSTTIALLERFYDVLSGGIYVDGNDISRLNVNSYRSQLALVNQEPVLYLGSIRDNIVMGSNDQNVTDDAVMAACKDANIYDFVLSLPEGLDTMVGSKGSMMSGGQKQRIAIARALLRNPKILLLDEATSALDSESEKVVQDALDMASRGRTTIAVAHRLSTIQRADMIFVFDQGSLIETGTHHELIRRKGHYYELVNLQSVRKTDQ
ncbi:P-loop containing nucleoside triphosphate hydrolase protein [Xylariales sp. PMI_506]|nr:P-loop containing nucleoside triphosphate hydrolase protein [Xylariales sp. PMI_506]